MLAFAKKFVRFYATSTLRYDIPEKYRNAFFLANAPLFDYTNWFIHRSYEVCFTDLVDRLRKTRPDLDNTQAAKKVINIINYLEPCSSLVDIRFPVRKSDGLYEVVRGFRAYHALHLDNAPCLGGMRICADLNRDHVKALSILSTFKHACMDIPMTGAHGGLKISGPDYKSADLKAIIKTYGHELSKRKTNVDVLEPDLYCGSQEMAWISEEFAKSIDDKRAACAVGKPCDFGGLKNYDELLANGAVFTLKCFLDNKEIMKEIQLEGGLANMKYIVQGLGKTGAQIAALLSEAGATCVGVKEHDAFIYMPEGIPVRGLLEYKKKTGSILEFNTKAKPSSANQIFTNECDILILAATHRSLQCHVAERIQAKVVVEVAHAAMTPTANRILVSRKRLVLPDIFASAGVSVASYLECMSNLQHPPYNILSNLLLTKDIDSVLKTGDIKMKVESIMKKSYGDIIEILDKFKLGVDVRTAAYTKGITNIFQKIYDKKICH